MKKFLVLLTMIFSLQTFAQEFNANLSEIDKQSQAVEQSKQINQSYKQISAFCSGQNFDAALVTICNTELKAKLENEFKERLNLLVVHKLETANKNLTDALAEQKCVSYFRAKLEDANKSYLAGDNCAQLKAKFEAP